MIAKEQLTGIYIISFWPFLLLYADLPIASIVFSSMVGEFDF